jgi:hypothetical protein
MTPPPSDIASYAAAGASVIAALGLIFTGLVTLRGQKAIKNHVADTVAQLATSNGIPPGLLLERQEGYRILLAKPNPADRTTSEQGYVDLIASGGRNIGHIEPSDKTIVAGEHAPTTQAERDVRPRA